METKIKTVWTSHFDRFWEYNVLVSDTKQRIEELIKYYPKAGYISTVRETDIVERQGLFFCNAKIARSCD